MKTCSKCKIEKPFEDFHKNRSVKDGHAKTCKNCKKHCDAKYYASDKGIASIKRNTERNQTPDGRAKRALVNRKYNVSEKGKAAQARRNASDSGKAAVLKYQNSPRGRMRLLEAAGKRRAIKASTTSDNWQASEVFESANWQCFYCGIDVVQPNRAEVGYQPNEAHADHFIPLSNGGTNERKNIVCSCGQCNLSKGSKDPFDFIRDNINQK